MPQLQRIPMRNIPYFVLGPFCFLAVSRVEGGLHVNVSN